MSTTIESVNTMILAAQLGPAIDEESHHRITQFFDLRTSWSTAHNIAGPRAMQAPWRTDLLDAVALASVVEAKLPLVDVGSGSGTPGLLLACLLPSLPITLVEPIAKRTAFLRHATSTIGLGNVKTRRGRWPMSLGCPSLQVVSRAVVPPEDWPTLASSAPETSHIIRMLATKRPPVKISGWRQASAVDYRMPDGIQRRIERWARHDT